MLFRSQKNQKLIKENLKLKQEIQELKAKNEENISHNAYYNRIRNSNNLSKQAKREIYLKNRMKGNIDWGLER